MIVAIIPARWGSKGIEHKNITRLCGKPLIVWTIEQALASRLIDEVIVSSDSEIIGRVATEAGARFVHRSNETAADYATTESVILETLDRQPLDDCEYLVLLQPTSPIRQPHDIDNAICTLRSTNSDSCFSARRLEGYAWWYGAQGLKPYYKQRQRRQTKSFSQIEENGSIYVMRTERFREVGDRICESVVWYEMHPLDSFQIDTPEDLEMMRKLIPLRLSTATSTGCCATTPMASTTKPNLLPSTFSR